MLIPVSDRFYLGRVPKNKGPVKKPHVASGFSRVSCTDP